MDVDATLAEIRKLVRDYDTSPIEDVDRLVELVKALDDWFTSGGYMPTQWVLA